MLYLVGKYDTEHKISFADFDSTAIANQYLMFQMSGSSLPPPSIPPSFLPSPLSTFSSDADSDVLRSYIGQGPYLGQLGWFSLYHSEKIPSAIARYSEEGKRILSVLEDILKDKDYLVGNKASYADLSFVVWNMVLDYFPVFSTWKTEYPRVAAWQDRLEKRESVKRVQVIKEEEKAKGLVAK